LGEKSLGPSESSLIEGISEQIRLRKLNPGGLMSYNEL
jgi:hypothetical protein|tara:strand:- start:500 stop:613 length:114 start_codon:yes stop_codon:yes gene_type:complete